jgi:glutaredoxin
MSDEIENTLYSKEGCSWCDALREKLIGKRVRFTEVKVDASVENLAELKERFPEVKTVPQFFVGKVRVGGHDETVMYLADVYGHSDKSF